MTTVAEVDVKINAKLDSFLQSSKKAEKIINDLDTRLNKLSNKKITATVSTKVGSTKDLALLERRLSYLNSKKFNATVTAKVGSTAELAKLEQRIKKLQSSTALVNPNVSPMQGGSNFGLGSLAAGVGGYFSAKEVQEYADAWTSAGNKLRAAAEISGVQVRSLQDLNDMANSTRSSLEATVDLYAKLVRSSSGVAASELEIAKATETVTKAFKAGGSTTQEQIAGIVQLGQALGSGVLQGDELRSLRENAPLIAQAIANEFKTTVGGLKKLGEEGQLTSDRVFKAILSGSNSIDAAFKATNSTIADGFTRVKNALTEYIGSADQANGASAALVAGLTKLADNFDTVADVTMKFAAVIASAFIGRAIGGMLASLGLATAQMITFTRTLSFAASAASAARFAPLAAAFGPIGAVVAVAAGAALYFGNSALEAGDNSEKLRGEMRQLGILSEDLKPKVDAAAESLKNLAPDDLRKKLKEINDEIKRMKGQSLKGILGLADNDEKTLGDIQQTIDKILNPRSKASGAKRSGASALSQLIEDAQSGDFTLEQIETRLNEIAAVKIDSQFDNMVDALRRALPYMKSLQNYANKTFQPQLNGVTGGGSSGGPISEGTIAERQSRSEQTWLQQQRLLEDRSEREKEIAKITEQIMKDAKEAGQSMSKAAAEQEATSRYEKKLETSNYQGSISGFVDRTISAESGGNVNAKNPLSSATGLGQFIESTWINLFKKYFPDKAEGMSREAILALRTDANYSKQLIEAYAKENADILQKAGVSVNEAALHLAHFLGPQGAIKILQAAPGTLAADVLGPAAAKANPTIIGNGRTVEDVIAYGQKRAGMTTAGTQKIESRESFDKNLKQKQQELEFLKEETALRGQLNPMINDYGQKLTTLQTAQELLTMAQNEGTAAGKELSGVQQLLYGDLSKLSPEARAQAEAMRALAEKYGETESAGNRLKDSQDKLANSMQETSQFGKDILGGFISDLKNGKSATEALAGALEKVADKLLDVGLDALFGLGKFGGGGASPLGGLFSSIFGGLFAEGGKPPLGKVSVVGEKGPELFVPDASGTIIPNDSLTAVNVPQAQLRPSVGSATPTNITITLDSKTDSSVIQEIADTRIQGAAPTIVKTSVQKSQQVTKQNMGSYIADTQKRKM